MKTVLMVAEKPSLAASIAKILSGGSSTSRKGRYLKSLLNTVRRFNFVLFLHKHYDIFSSFLTDLLEYLFALFFSLTGS